MNVRRKNEGIKKELTKMLGGLLEKERDDDNFAKLIDTKI